ncbi:MAG: hypothetical protein IKG93_06855 [Clostridiales bacterium]|nr:hypothetical protein [Clostridiales bacterium]
MIAATVFELAKSLRRKRLEYLDREIGQIPFIATGSHVIRGKRLNVVRAYSKEGTVSGEHLMSTPDASKLFAMLTRKESLQDIRANLRYQNYLNNSEPRDIKTTNFTNVPNAFSKEAFDNLVELNDTKILRPHVFDGHIFRSKSEMIYAQIIKSLGLEYKYEVIVAVGNQTYYIDFAVYCPETGRFFFIEHFGLMDDNDYRFKSFGKMTNYLSHQLQDGLDIIYTFEQKDSGLSANIIKGKLLGVIAAQMLSC